MRGQGLTRQDTPDASFPISVPVVGAWPNPSHSRRTSTASTCRSLWGCSLAAARSPSTDPEATWAPPSWLSRVDPAHQGRVGRGPPGRRRGTRWLARPHRQWPRGRRRLGVRLFNAPGGFRCGFSSLRIFFSCSSRVTGSEIARGCAALTSRRIHDGPGVCLPGVGIADGVGEELYGACGLRRSGPPNHL